MYTVYRFDFLRVPGAITIICQTEWGMGVRDVDAPVKIMQLEKALEVE